MKTRTVSKRRALSSPSPLWGGVRGGGGSEGGATGDSAPRATFRLVLNHPHPYPLHKGEGFGEVRAESGARP